MTKRDANVVMSESFLEMRAKLLEVAATLDRIDRSPEGLSPDSIVCEAQREKIEQAIAILLSKTPDRACQLQQLFSQPYQSDWRETMQV